MKVRLPSPAMVVSLVALVVATSGTAIAARILITSSSQVKNNTLTGADVKNGSLTGIDVRNGSIKGPDLAPGTVAAPQLRADVRSALSRPAATSATEVVRAKGPVVSAGNGGSATVATLKGLAAGSYFISAKVVLASASPEQKGLLDVVLNSETNSVKCTLDAGGNADEAMGTIITPGSKSPANLHLQLTRTIASPADVVLRCESSVPWSAGGTSIVAVALGSSTRSEVAG